MRCSGVVAVPEAGVVALEPLRLAALQAYLGTLADGCRRGQRDVAGALIGTEESAAGQEAELRRVAEWCRVQADGIARRRRILDSLPSALPLPDVVFRSRAAAETSATELAERISEALERDPPLWSVLAGLLRQVDRRTHSPAFLATLRRSLGPDALARLPFLLEVSHWAQADEDGDALPGLAPARDVVGDLVNGATTPEPPVESAAEPPGMAWRVVQGLGLTLSGEQRADLAQAEEDAGWAKDVVRGLTGLLGVADDAAKAGPWVLPLAAAGLATDVADLIVDPEAKDVLALVSDGLLAAAPFAGGAAPVMFAAGALAAVVGFALGRPWDLPDYDRDVRRAPDGTGRRTYPSGSPSNTRVDTAGVPLAGYA
ncbi:hypothetical protein BH24ACT4_BH24ACT4_13340 [soil metagenome]